MRKPSAVTKTSTQTSLLSTTKFFQSYVEPKQPAFAESETNRDIVMVKEGRKRFIWKVVRPTLSFLTATAKETAIKDLLHEIEMGRVMWKSGA
jgi:hypothetical protein